MSVARIITEICAPWVTNVALFVILGLALGAPWPGITAALLTGPVPMLAILWLIRRGRVGNHHVTTRTQRGRVFALILGLLGLLAVLLTVMATPSDIWVALAAAVVFILLFAVVTVGGVKISVHVGVWVTHWLYLGVVISPWWALMLLLTPAVAWSRLRLVHHTPTEIIGGLVTGLVVVGLTLPAVL